MHLQFQGLALTSFMAFLCFFLNHRLPLGTAGGLGAGKGSLCQIRVSQKWHHWPLLGQICWDVEGCPVHCRMLGGILGLCPPDASSVPTARTMTINSQQCLQALPNVPGVGVRWAGAAPCSLRTTNTVDSGWCTGVVSLSQNYSWNDQARTIVFTLANPKDSNKTEQRQELNVLKCVSSQINIQNSSKLRMACGLWPLVFRPTEKLEGAKSLLWKESTRVD